MVKQIKARGVEVLEERMGFVEYGPTADVESRMILQYQLKLQKMKVKKLY